jgi:energy-coupling factor transporter ATP-binding protein EcfA2
MQVEALRQQFKQAYQTLQPQRPLLTPEDRDRFLVPFAQKTLDELEQLLELMPEDCAKNKIILSGHTGCGKSTLLAQLKQNIEVNYRVVFFSIADFVPPSDLSHIVLLFVMILELLRAMRRDSSLAIDPDFQDQMMAWLATSSGINMQQPIGFGNERWEIEKEEWFLEVIIQQIKTIERYFSSRVSELVTPLDRLSEILGQPKSLLVIVDDIDKIDIAVARKLFQDNIKSLFQTCAKAIFTVPITALRDLGIHSEILA